MSTKEGAKVSHGREWAIHELVGGHEKPLRAHGIILNSVEEKDGK
jgi:hypothetical protein